MSDPDNPAAPDSPADPLAVLATLPKTTQLLLRDYIAGLEAQAGTARAEADHHERARHREVNLLRMKLAGMRSERDDAVRALAELSVRYQASDRRDR